MFRHVALFRWVHGTSLEDTQEVAASLARLPLLIPEVRDYRIGGDAGLAEGNWDFVVVADFDDAAGWRAYARHPEHERLLLEQLRPLLAERAAIQYET